MPWACDLTPVVDFLRGIWGRSQEPISWAAVPCSPGRPLSFALSPLREWFNIRRGTIEWVYHLQQSQSCKGTSSNRSKPWNVSMENNPLDFLNRQFQFCENQQLYQPIQQVHDILLLPIGFSHRFRSSGWLSWLVKLIGIWESTVFRCWKETTITHKLPFLEELVKGSVWVRSERPSLLVSPGNPRNPWTSSLFLSPLRFLIQWAR